MVTAKLHGDSPSYSKNRVVIFYAITAVLTLFCNILSDPLDPDNDQDIDLLQNVPSLIRKIPIRKFTIGEVVHLKFLDGFTAELAGIGASAMSKAQQDM